MRLAAEPIHQDRIAIRAGTLSSVLATIMLPRHTASVLSDSISVKGNLREDSKTFHLASYVLQRPIDDVRAIHTTKDIPPHGMIRVPPVIAARYWTQVACHSIPSPIQDHQTVERQRCWGQGYRLNPMPPPPAPAHVFDKPSIPSGTHHQL